MNHKILRSVLILLVSFLYCTVTMNAWAGNKRIMSINAAKVLAERALVETVHGLKVRTTEEVVDMVAASFVGKVETKTAAKIKGIKFDEIIYDEDKDIAKVTASVSLESLTNVDGDNINLGNKVFKRVAFATSTPKNAAPIRALRAAELDAYKQLIKQVLGFTLESQTTVENYILTSDVVKTKVIASLYLANLTEYYWDKNGDAHVKMVLNVGDISTVLGENVVNEGEVVEVEGLGAQTADFKPAPAAKGASDAKGEEDKKPAEPSSVYKNQSIALPTK